MRKLWYAGAIAASGFVLLGAGPALADELPGTPDAGPSQNNSTTSPVTDPATTGPVTTGPATTDPATTDPAVGSSTAALTGTASGVVAGAAGQASDGLAKAEKKTGNLHVRVPAGRAAQGLVSGLSPDGTATPGRTESGTLIGGLPGQPGGATDTSSVPLGGMTVLKPATDAAGSALPSSADPAPAASDSSAATDPSATDPSAADPSAADLNSADPGSASDSPAVTAPDATPSAGSAPDASPSASSAPTVDVPITGASASASPSSSTVADPRLSEEPLDSDS